MNPRDSRATQSPSALLRFPDSGLRFRPHPNVAAISPKTAFRIAASKLETETDILWRREMLTDGYLARFLKVHTPQGDIEALTFVADHNSPKYVSGLTREAAARLIASAHGVLGSNIEYLDELASRLEELNLPDPEFFELYALARAASGAGAGRRSLPVSGFSVSVIGPLSDRGKASSGGVCSVGDMIFLTGGCGNLARATHPGLRKTLRGAPPSEGGGRC